MSATASLTWQGGFSPAAMAGRVVALGANAERETEALYGRVSLEGQQFAQINAPWTNRTGMARATLQGTAEGSGFSGVMTLAHGMDYGVWLELANQGRYAILPDALQHMAQVLEEGLGGILERAGGGI